MNRSILLLLVLLLASIPISGDAQVQRETGTNNSSLLDLLKPGQVVNISESPFGYKIELLTTQQVEKAIESRQKNPDKFNSKFTPKQSFGLSHPVIKSATRDYVTFLYDVPGIHHLQRHIAIRSIVEIYSYDSPKTDEGDAKTRGIPEKGTNGKR